MWRRLRDSAFFPVAGLLALLSLFGWLIWAVVTDPGPDYSGSGNTFTITATITKVTDESVMVDHVTVESSYGRATNWFTEGHSLGRWLNGENHSEVHDNYSEPGTWSSHKYRIGSVYTDSTEVNLKYLAPGMVVRVEGSIRASKIGKSSPYRAVFTTMTVIQG